MRPLLFLALFSLVATTLRAQQQEQKLLDRVLKPNTTLQSNEQGKKFEAAGDVLTKSARTKPFFISRRSWEKRYGGVQEFPVKEFGTAQSRFATREANTSSRNRLPKVNEPYATAAFVTRAAPDAGKQNATRPYAGNQQAHFVGKSQKALDQQPHPLTIDEVRELLNKNK